MVSPGPARTDGQVVSKRGTIDIQYPSNEQGKKLFNLLVKKAAKGEVSHTYGACVLPEARRRRRPLAGWRADRPRTVSRAC